jgi:hypothetical protein
MIEHAWHVHSPGLELEKSMFSLQDQVNSLMHPSILALNGFVDLALVQNRLARQQLKIFMM